MTTRYLRSTHEDGKVKSFSAEAKEAWATSKCCGHLLDPRKALTVEEIIQNHKDYDREFSSEPISSTDDEIREGLSLLVKHGMVEETT